MLDTEYRRQLQSLLAYGNRVGPRGLGTRELLDQKFMLADSRQNILDIPARHLNFKYLVAEWLWVQFGHSDLASLVQYNSQMKRFSDDGIYLTGAYGPHIGGGWNRCVEKLRKDPASRQGVIQIPRPQIETIDEPCTLSLQFIIRSSALHCLATMRSSDMWLGMPYDVFTFTQIQNVMAGELGVGRGTFVLNAGSSHIYESDVPKILAVVNAVEARTQHTRDLPGRPPAWLDDVFVTQSREPIPSSVDRHNDPWVRFANVLTSPNWSTALYELSTSGSFMRPPNDPRVTFTAFDLESPSEPESHV